MSILEVQVRSYRALELPVKWGVIRRNLGRSAHACQSQWGKIAKTSGGAHNFFEGDKDKLSFSPQDTTDRQPWSQWTPEQDALLTAARGEGLSWKAISDRVGRNLLSCSSRWHNVLKYDLEDGKLNTLAIRSLC